MSVQELAALILRHERELHFAAGALMILVGVMVWLVEVCGGARATYGRYASLSTARWYGPTVHPKMAWVFQESWAFMVALMLITVGEPRCLASRPNQILLAMFMGHYAYRSFWYPLRMRGGARMPIGLCLLASLFCAFNGYLQARAWTALDLVSVATPAEQALFGVGCALWAVGLAVNLHSDSVLRNLRKPGETGYKIPYGGAFELVTGANYFGEILEWCGYALAAQHIVAVAFAVFTFCNTGPRAYHHHLWYREKFDDYPPARRALIPWVW